MVRRQYEDIKFMTIFVTGATGVLGRPVVKGLVKRGHKIHALCRSSSNRARLLEDGAIPEEIDLYDIPALTEVLQGCDTVLHLATKIPATADLKKPGIWDENDKLRRNGMASIAKAAQAAGTVKTLLYPSISFFYGDGGSGWLEVKNAVTEPASFLQSTLDAEANVGAFAAGDVERRGIVLRFGSFYGPTSPDSSQNLVMARKGLFLPLAAPSTYRSMIWIDDAANAVLKALDAAPTGVYDVVENTPSTQKESARALAAAIGRSNLYSLPRWLLRIALPAELRQMLARSQRISNTRFRETTGWQPTVPSQREGWRLLEETVHG
jgi:nucleoside-diphosphate-sugar epimerase